MNSVSRKIYVLVVLAMTMGFVMTSCDDTESYAELLEKERKACNAFLAGHRVENSIPADGNFEVGEDAPYYRLEEEGNIYMQVLDKGDMEDMAQYDDLIYFRYMRMSLIDWYLYNSEIWSGNADNMASAPTYFRYDNYSLSATSQYGTGIQWPLKYLGMGCRVNLIVKSQYGLTDEIAYVTPFIYNIRYFRPLT